MELNLRKEEEEMPDGEIENICSQRADEAFQRVCVAPLRAIDPSLHFTRTSGWFFSIRVILELYWLTSPSILVRGSHHSQRPDRSDFAHLIQITLSLVESDIKDVVRMAFSLALQTGTPLQIKRSAEAEYVHMHFSCSSLLTGVYFSYEELEPTVNYL
jgi:hypothetical protein